MKIHSIEITFREVLFCVTVGSIFIFLFFILDSYFIAKDQNDLSRMNRAIILSNIEEFKYGIDTNVGDVFSPFELEPYNGSYSMQFSEIKYKFLLVKKICEEWTRHTYTTTDSKGNTKTHVYYSWDYSYTKKDFPEYVKFNNLVIPFNKIEGFDFKKLELSKDNFDVDNWYKVSGTYAYKNSWIRYYYEVIPLKINGSFFGNLQKDFPTEIIEIYENKSPDDLFVYLTEKIKNKNVYRWILAIILLIIFCGIFCYKENKWLNKN